MQRSTIQLLATCIALLEIPCNGQQFPAEPARVGVKTLQTDPGTCPLAGDRETAINELTENTTDIIRNMFSQTPTQFQPCSEPEWRRVAFINMTDPSHSCPSGLAETSYSKRTCGQTSDGGRCDSTTFPADNTQYNKVCGRIIGYTYYWTCAFQQYSSGGKTLDGNYVDGVSLTHGSPRQHIWSFASGGSEVVTDQLQNDCYCPCSARETYSAPPFVGDDFFCESGRNVPWMSQAVLYPDDPLWDGKNCPSGSTCCELNNPPWFIKTLPNSTTDDIEFRLCSWSFSHASTPIELIELYVQ